MFRCDPSKLKSSDQKVPVNLASRSLTMFWGTPQYFTMYLKNNRAVSSAVQYLGVEIKVAYFENLSTITRMLVKSPVFGKPLMKSSETLSHGLLGIRSGSSNPGTFCLSTSSCWQVRQVLVYSTTS